MVNDNNYGYIRVAANRRGFVKFFALEKTVAPHPLLDITKNICETQTQAAVYPILKFKFNFAQSTQGLLTDPIQPYIDRRVRLIRPTAFCLKTQLNKL